MQTSLGKLREMAVIESWWKLSQTAHCELKNMS